MQRVTDHSIFRGHSKPVTLPSIGQVIPELQRIKPSRDIHNKPEWQSMQHQASSSTLASIVCAASYRPTLSQHRRTAHRDEIESLYAHRVRRLYLSPGRPTSRQLAPTSTRPTSAAAGGYTSHVSLDEPNLPTSASTLFYARFERRHVSCASPSNALLPSSLNLARATPIYGRWYNGYPDNNYRLHSQLAGSAQEHYATSFSTFSSTTPHISSRYGHVELSGMRGIKQPKSRRALPKETTNKLRTWLASHLRHPYPTEDEKQQLMHQTGLQRTQISNWFINARRRRLPAISNRAHQ